LKINDGNEVDMLCAYFNRKNCSNHCVTALCSYTRLNLNVFGNDLCYSFISCKNVSQVLDRKLEMINLKLQ